MTPGGNGMYLDHYQGDPKIEPVAIGGMTKEQIDDELQKGMDDVAAGRIVSADEVEAEMRRLYGI